MRARCPVNQKVFASGGAAAQQNTESVLGQGLRGDSEGAVAGGGAHGRAIR